MNKYLWNFAVIIVITTFGNLLINAQQPPKAPDYKLSKIKIVPFDETEGKFLDEILPDSERSFFNDLSISLFVTFEISGEAGSFEAGRNINISVTEGKKTKFQKSEQIGLIGEGGKYFVPVFLYGSMCDEIKITARLSGQKTTSTLMRTVPFLCGE